MITPQRDARCYLVMHGMLYELDVQKVEERMGMEPICLDYEYETRRAMRHPGPSVLEITASLIRQVGVNQHPSIVDTTTPLIARLEAIESKLRHQR